MYSKDDKHRLYWLIDQYLSSEIDESTFCDEFYYVFDLGIDYSTLSETEYQTFEELDSVSSRFSEFENDHKIAPQAFKTAQELREKIIETKERLKKQWL